MLWNSSYQKVKKLKKNVYLIQKDNQKYILKKSGDLRPKNKFLTILIRISGLERMHFQRELAVLSFLSKCSFNYFKFPIMFEGDRSSVLMEYIEGKNGFDRNRVPHSTLVNSLVEMHTSVLKNDFPIRKDFLDYIVNPTMNLIRACFTILPKHLPPLCIFKAFCNYIKRYFRITKMTTPLLMHKDLKPEQNIITTEDKELCFIDFGSARLERRLVLGDIIQMSFNMETFTIEGSLILKYISTLKETIFISKDFAVKSHLWIGLLFIMINNLRNGQKMTTSVLFIRKTLLSNNKFDEWCAFNSVCLV